MTILEIILAYSAIFAAARWMHRAESLIKYYEDRDGVLRHRATRKPVEKALWVQEIERGEWRQSPGASPFKNPFSKKA